MRRRILNLLLATTLLTTMIPMLSAPTTKGGVTLTILTRHDTSIQGKFEPAFLSSQLAIDAGVTDIVWKGFAAPFWEATIQAGGVNIAWGGGPTLFDTLASRSLLLDIQDYGGVMEEVNHIDDTIAGAPMKRYDSQDNLVWVAAAISTFGFTINKDTLTDINNRRAAEGRPPMATPESWEDLAEPIYLEDPAAMGIVNAPDSTSNTRAYEIILQAFGWEQGWKYITLMGANSNIYHGSAESLSAVVEGAVAVALTIDFYGFSAQLENPQCEYIVPPGLSIVNGDPIALTNPSPQGSPPGSASAAAQAFVKYILSKEGQSVWLDPHPVPLAARLPVREDAFDTPIGQQSQVLHDAYTNAKSTTGIDFSDDIALSYEQSLLWYFQATITDPHTDLVAAWSSVTQVKDVDAAAYSSLADQLGSALVSEDEAKNLNEKMTPGVDEAFRIQKITEWDAAARSKYQHVKQSADAILHGTTTTQITTTTTGQTTTSTTPPPTPIFTGVPALAIALLSVAAASLVLRREKRRMA